MSQMSHPKLNGVLPKDIICLLDYDLTLAEKNDPNDTDNAPLTCAHYEGLLHLGERIGRNIILTARGEKSVLRYFGTHADRHGRLPNTTLASNSGHIWHKLDQKRDSEPNVIAIPNYSLTQLWALSAEIHTLVTALKSEFPAITADSRDLCGAVVFQFPADDSSAAVPSFSQFDKFQKFANQLRDDLPEDLKAKIQYVPKNWQDSFGGQYQMRGYIDMIPKGMSKGLTSPVLFDHYKSDAENPFVIVAGDSGADYEMMTALARQVPADRRLFISVGKGLVAHDLAHAEAHNGERLLDIVFAGNGLSPVNQMHVFLEHVGMPGRSPAQGKRAETAPVLIR